MKKIFKNIILFLIIIAPSVTFGWSLGGHRTAGAMVYYYLKQNSPATIPKILQTLTFHPWYNTRWSDSTKNLSGEAKGIELFMLASTFPDDARKTDLGSGEKFKWHYVAWPYVPEADDAKSLPPQTPNAQEKIIKLLSTVKDEKDGEQRALDICWIFHLIEDTHQPLHAATIYDKNHPVGDNMGNQTYIKFASTPEEKLHHFWDYMPAADTANAIAKAKELMHKYPESSLDELKTNNDPEGWIKNESYPLALKYGYINGKIDGTQDNPTQVDESYRTNSLPIAERRLVISGIRLARKLMEIYSQ